MTRPFAGAVRLLPWAVCLALALALRLLCLHAEPWLDEVLSFNLSRQASTPLGVWAVRHDNNHHLNTLWLWFCQADDPAWRLRLHSLLAGVAAVALAGLAGRRLRAEVPALCLASACWWLVLESADARGYSLAVCFALAAFLALDAYLTRPGWASLVTFWATAILAFQSHLTFLHVWFGLAAWSARRFGRDDPPLGEQLRRMLTVHLVPAVAFAAFYLVSLRGMEVAGGPPPEYGRTLMSLVSRGLGGPGPGWSAWPFVVAGAVLFATGLIHLIRAKDDVWVFFAVTVVAVPGLTLLARPAFFFERYFLLSFTFGLLVIAHQLGRMWASRSPTSPLRGSGVRGEGVVSPAPNDLPSPPSKCLAPSPLPLSPEAGERGITEPPARLLVVALLGVFLAGSCWTAASYAVHGRGRFRDVAALVRAEGGTVTALEKFQVPTCLGFYAPDVRFVSPDELPPGGADWLLLQCHDDRSEPGEEIEDRHGNRYRLARAYPALGPAAWGWFVFRNAAKTPK